MQDTTQTEVHAAPDTAATFKAVREILADIRTGLDALASRIDNEPAVQR